MRTIAGLSQVDVIYRRIDDLFLDPLAFRKDSVLGVPGLFNAWKKGNVALANAPGAGVADDKIIYTYVPKIIKYYLDEDPILPNVPSYLCVDKLQRQHVLENLDKLVVKPANESGGYGMLIGPQASRGRTGGIQATHKSRSEELYGAALISPHRTRSGRSNGRASPCRSSSFVLQGEEAYVTPGGLTRVAMVKGSFVVNSSQGGGSKDTWVVENA